MNGKFCKWCPREETDGCPENRFTAPLRFCPVENQSGDFEDAAKFEARVARLLSDPAYIEKSLPCWCYTPDFSGCLDKTTDCRWCRLKVARIEVEEEMDG